MAEALQRKMGREIRPEFNYINIGDYGQKIKIMCTGGDVTDLLGYGFAPSSDLIKWGEEGMFEELTQHMDKLPIYHKILESDKKAKYAVYSGKGELYFFYAGTYQGNTPRVLSNFSTAAVRKDILDKHNLPIPETVDAFTETARALKEAYPDIYPIILHEEWQQPEMTLLAANHTFNDRYYNGEKHVYGPLDDGYKEALQVMHTWYEEGLISPDFFVNTSENGEAAVSSGQAFLIPSCWEGWPASWKKNNRYPDQTWVSIPIVKNEKYGEPWTFTCPNQGEWSVRSEVSTALSGKAKEKDALLEFMDLQYSDEVRDLLNWGVKDFSYQVMEDGSYEYKTEFMDGTRKWIEYALGQGSCRSAIFPNVCDQGADNQQVPVSDMFINGELYESVKRTDMYLKFKNAENTIPGDSIQIFPLTTEENEEYANIMTPVATYASEQKALFVKGERSFDEWDAYLEEINRMGNIEKAMAIYDAHIVK